MSILPAMLGVRNITDTCHASCEEAPTATLEDTMRIAGRCEHRYADSGQGQLQCQKVQRIYWLGRTAMQGHSITGVQDPNGPWAKEQYTTRHRLHAYQPQHWKEHLFMFACQTKFQQVPQQGCRIPLNPQKLSLDSPPHMLRIP